MLCHKSLFRCSPCRRGVPARGGLPFANGWGRQSRVRHPSCQHYSREPGRQQRMGRTAAHLMVALSSRTFYIPILRYCFPETARYSALYARQVYVVRISSLIVRSKRHTRVPLGCAMQASSLEANIYTMSDRNEPSLKTVVREDFRCMHLKGRSKSVLT